MAHNSVARRLFRARVLAPRQAIGGIYFRLKMLAKVCLNGHSFVRATVLRRKCCATRPAMQAVSAPTDLQRCDR